MDTELKQKLIQQIKELNKQGNYKEGLEILNDDLLEKANDSELYAEFCQIKCRLCQNDYGVYAEKSLEIKIMQKHTIIWLIPILIMICKCQKSCIKKHYS